MRGRERREDFMPMKWPGLGLGALLMLVACKSWPFGAQDREEHESLDVPRVHVEFQDVQYDGFVLSGRILLSPEETRLRLDKRLIPTVDVDIQAVADCLRQPHPYIVSDVLPLRASEDDLLILEPGYWYGSTVRFALFDEHFTGIGPECIDARLQILSFDGRQVANISVRAERPAEQVSDGGIPAGLLPLIDDPAFSILKKLPEVELSEPPELDGGVSPPRP